MEHTRWQDLIPFYIAQTLPPAEHRQFEAHLANCTSCQYEINEWQTIAAAVWSKTDAATRQLPPLSPEVYNRLKYRAGNPRQNHPPRPNYARAESAYPPGRTTAAQRNISIPVTLVAGILVALVFGALIVSQLAVRNTPREIALNVTPQADATASPAGTIRPTDDAPFGSQALIPTNTPLPPTDAPPLIPSLPNTAIAPPVIVQATNTPLPDDIFSVQSVTESAGTGEGPYITLTPGIIDSGAPLCYAINPTTNPIQVPLYPEPNRNSPPVAYLLPQTQARTLVEHPSGWYQIYSQDIQRPAWIPPDAAILEGNCLQLWTATPPPTPIINTPAPPTATPTPLANGVNFAPLPPDTVAEVLVPYADLRAGADRTQNSINVVQRGEVFSAIGYSLLSNDWIYIRNDDGRGRWALRSDFELRPAVAATPTYLPQP